MCTPRNTPNRRANRHRTLGFLASGLEDRRLPPPDVMGYLADRLIRREDLDAVAEHVRESWPRVQCVRCGILDDRPYFSIHISPFSAAAQQEHWPLADWIERSLETRDCQFLFLPPAEEKPFSSQVTVYQAPRNGPPSSGQRAA